jgi:pimeloyl-ACP methyl ester carboxylesterase
VAAAGSAKVDGLILWSTPLLGRQATATDIQTGARKTADYAGQYWRKLFRRETWGKIFKLRLNMRVILRVLFGHFRGQPEIPGVREAELLDAFKTFAGPVLFVYAGNDPEAPAASAAYREIAVDHGLAAEFHEIPGANHNFYSLVWKHELLECSFEWLVKNLGTAGVVGKKPANEIS